MSPLYAAAIDADLCAAPDLAAARALVALGRPTASGGTEELVLALALLSALVRAGHVRASFEVLAARRASLPGALDAALAGEALREVLDRTGLSGDEASPLVVDDGALYFSRLWREERELADALLRLARRSVGPLDFAALRRASTALLGDVNAEQRLAVELAALNALTLVTGGPGTGKTYTVARLIGVLAEHAVARAERCRILLLAPTGKAAARLAESVNRSVGALALSAAAKALLPTTASTIHRALGVSGDGREPRHHPGAPLPAEVVVVDEISMVDLGLMRRIASALGPGARLVLLGDPHQLASVQAGAVLADLVDAEPGLPGPSATRRVKEVFGRSLPAAASEPSPIAAVSVHLVEGRRQARVPTLATFAEAVRRGDVSAAFTTLERADAELEWREPELGEGRSAHRAYEALLAAPLVDGFAPLAASRTPEEALATLTRFRVLAAHRRGAGGVEHLDELVTARLRGASFDARRSAHFHGRPVIVTVNDPSTQLGNGDVGVVLRDADGRLEAWFESVDAPRALGTARLPAHESAYAMTIHKSQGSELDEVVVVLPPAPSPICTRELLYTAVTRARRRVVLIGTREVITASVRARVERGTGLAARLRAADPTAGA